MFFNRPLIAIDVGSSSVKVVEISGKGDRKLRAIGLELLPEGSVLDGVIQNQSVVESVVKGLIKKLKISTTGRRAAISLGGSSLLIKKVGFPPMSDAAELHEQIFYQAEQHFQHDLDELYFDYSEISKVPDQTGNIPILLVGAKRDVVEQYLAMVRSVGMKIGVIDCEAFSVANMFEYNYGIVDSLIAMVNIGASAIQVSLLTRGEYLYTRDISLGGNDYSGRIMGILGVDRANAESLKVAASMGEDSIPAALTDVINEVNQQIVNELQTTINYFLQSGEAPSEFNKVSHVFLCGGGSRTLGLDAAVAAALQIPVQITNPFHRIEVDPKRFQMDYILSQGHLYGVAVGLALRGMNDGSGDV
jgi:type IV pilus assembly protein PilM